jgi:hypothetical protein
MHTKTTVGFLALLFFAACTYTLKIKDGRTAYERKQFAVATPMLEKEFARAKTRNEKGQIAYLLGDAFRRIGRDEKSLQWFKTAYDNNGGAEALKAYAFALKKNGALCRSPRCLQKPGHRNRLALRIPQGNNGLYRGGRLAQGTAHQRLVGANDFVQQRPK